MRLYTAIIVIESDGSVELHVHRVGELPKKLEARGLLGEALDDFIAREIIEGGSELPAAAFVPTGPCGHPIGPTYQLYRGECVGCVIERLEARLEIMQAATEEPE